MEPQDDGDTNGQYYARNDAQMFDKGVGNLLKPEDEPKLSKLQHYWDLPECWEETRSLQSLTPVIDQPSLILINSEYSSRILKAVHTFPINVSFYL